MSVDAWVIATVDHLRTELATAGHIPGGATKAKHYIDIQPMGHPPAKMGDFYISIDEAGSQNKLVDTGLNEVFSMAVFVTVRTGKYAPDRYGDLYRNNARTLRKLTRAAAVAIHGNHALRALANTELDGVGDSFIQPMWLTFIVPTRPAGPDWIGSDQDGDGSLVRELRFTGGRRIQAMDVAG